MAQAYTGATAVGVRVNDGVVLAAEKRVSYGGFVMSKSARKVFLITERLGIACAGLFADLQAVGRMLEAEVRFYEVSLKRTMRTAAAAKLLANILYSYKLFPLISETLVGGIDDEGPHLFVLDPVGSVIEDDYAAVGSGAPIAIGVIEGEYRKDASLEEAKQLTVKAVRVAMERDASSGDGIDILVISRDGVSEESITVKRTF